MKIGRQRGGPPDQISGVNQGRETKQCRLTQILLISTKTLLEGGVGREKHPMVLSLELLRKVTLIR
ncbi:hypothetical protein GLW08_11045 [Pontibacillus yanchengensis]|uniref:Uncharacterized protein n=1 Tax=Pontibacillus yanchengensis TaxID=462910 RepID=A0ACC7VGP5_9BACI|nr:hypothetical protein [Pontibacillus yanchengensis]